MTWMIAMDMVSKNSLKQDGKTSRIGSRSSIGADLDYLDAERSIKSHPDDNIKRRTLMMKKINDSWGFTLQTYAVKHKKTNEIEIMTFVDYIEITGPAYMAGMRKGDVILSVDGQSSDGKSHKELVSLIRGCGDKMRMVVLFEDCCKKVELHDRIFRLKEILAHKKMELKELEIQEKEIIDEVCNSRGLTRFDRIRQSMISTMSTNSWDRYSMIQSPQLLEFPVPKVTSISKSSFEEDQTSSIGDLDDSFISAPESDADSGMCICCPTMDDQIALKTIKEPEKKSKMNNSNGIHGTNKRTSYEEKDEETKKYQRYSIPFMYTDYVYINEEDESTEL